MHAFFKTWLILAVLFGTQILFPVDARTSTNLSFEHLSNEDGFSQSSVRQSLEDKYGFIWIVSNNGLSKYDGYHNTRYIFDASKPRSIPSNNITSILVDAQGRLWVASDRGLALYNYATNNFKIIDSNNSNLKHSKIDTLSSAFGEEIYVTAKDALYRINAKSQKVTLVITNTPLPTNIDYIKDEKSRVWISSRYDGSFMFDKETGQLHDLSKPNPWHFTLPKIAINKIEVIGEKYWIATANGLITLDESTEQQQTITKSNTPYLPSNTINDIRFDGENLWVATNRGLVITRDDLSIHTLVNQDNALSNGLQDSNVTSIFLSENSTAWIGTATAGLHKFHPALHPVKLFQATADNNNSLSGREVVAFASSANGDIWAATKLNGLNRFNQEFNYFTQHAVNTDAFINDIEIDSFDKIWMATSEGLQIYQISDSTLVFDNQIHANDIFNKTSIFKGKVWAWHSGKGLLHIDPESYEETLLALPSEVTKATAIFSDERDRLWLQTNLGILISDLTSNQYFRPSGLTDYGRVDVVTVYEHQDAYWLVSRNQGIFALNKATLGLQAKIESLDDNATKGIRAAVGIENKIWYGSRKGVFSIDLATASVVKQRSKAAINFSELHRSAMIATSEQNLLVGGSVGVHYIETNKQFEVFDSPKVPQLLSVSVPELGSQNDSTRSAFMLDRFEMPHSQSRINIEFGVVNSINSSATEYRYILDGLDDDWTYNAHARLASYSYLTFGNYNFKVQARTNGGEWSQSRELAITVEKPFWLHNRALIFYMLLIVCLATYQIYKRVHRNKRHQTLSDDVERLTLSLSSSGDELWDWDIASGKIYRQNIWKTIDFPKDSLRGQTDNQNNIHENDAERVTIELQKHIEGKTEFFELAYRVKTFNGDWVWVLDRGKVVEHDAQQNAIRMMGTLQNISHLKRAEEQLLKLANSDQLTNLPNRSFFQANHENLVRKEVSHALICLDMDNFKRINDSLGHQTGDLLIKQIARRLEKITTSSSTTYRLGGDAFSMLLEETTSVHRISHIAQDILTILSCPFYLNKQEFVLGVSIGIATYPEDGTSHQELLKNADTAMYFAKNSGGSNYQFFSGEMNQNAVRQLQIENLIRFGLKEDLFSVYYQPKIDISSGRLVSMEALVRFEHPQKGIVSPGQFIPLAEQTGQILEIGERVLRRACIDTKRWVDAGLFTGRVAVNISAKQFELPDLDERIQQILKQVGLSPLHLECEITEGTLMENPEQALNMMQRLRERGIHLALDDFGTGYSSLAYLKKFPIHTLKIDKAFIDDITSSSVDKHLTESIINIAHNLGLKVVAEGVEHEQQLDILKQYECEMLQGYLFSKPINASKFGQMLSVGKDMFDILGVKSDAKDPVL
ncbi:EAL domain-containing protein [Glaciecola sp. MH2013]|uniref:EAL domain-containing protein n=1 Tax=Glaciecola sp. MH2013 TaxID=2785524 RepID=UPI00189EF15E|nr:EAL domain-containing protein [Glaciecola sp. MH2013]MBF7073262.1 EAL domain-containing protein [Glaciecola sp. MH2013]